MKITKEAIKAKQKELLGNDFTNYEVERLIEHILIIEEKLSDAVEYLCNMDYGRDDALETMEKEEFVDWNIMWERVGSKGITVITQDMIREWEEEWEEEHE